jgi:hypothetical protein
MPTKCVSRRVIVRSTRCGHCRSCYSLQCWRRRNLQPCASSTRAMIRPQPTMRCSCLKTVERVRSKACVHAEFTVRPACAGVGSLSSAMVLFSSLNVPMATASPAETPERPHFTLQDSTLPAQEYGVLVAHRTMLALPLVGVASHLAVAVAGTCSARQGGA